MTTVNDGTSTMDQDFIGRLLSPFWSEQLATHDREPESSRRWEREKAMGQHRFVASSPGYAVSRRNDLFEIALFWAFPGVQPSDIHIQLEDDGRMLHITGNGVASGHRDGGPPCPARFEKRFVLARDVNTRKLRATFHENGVLILSAPMLRDWRRRPSVS